MTALALVIYKMHLIPYRSIHIHPLLQRPLRRRLGLAQDVLRDVDVEPLGFGSDPGHLEFKVAFLVVVVDEVDAEHTRAIQTSVAAHIEGVHSVSVATHILAASFTASLIDNPPTSNFSNSVFANCLPFPTAAALYP